MINFGEGSSSSSSCCFCCSSCDRGKTKATPSLTGLRLEFEKSKEPNEYKSRFVVCSLCFDVHPKTKT